MPTVDHLLLERIFSPGIFTDFAKNQQSAEFSQIISSAGLISELPSIASVGEVFDFAFSLLSAPGVRNEYVYKNILAEKILLGRHSLNTAVLIQEMRALRSKADAVVFNGTSTAYEIKSGRDSLARLPLQIEDYRKVFARVAVVADAKHSLSLEKFLPEDVGILTLSKKLSLSTIRPAQDNLESLEAPAMLDALQLSELEAMLSLLDQEVPQVPNTQRRKAYSEILSSFSPSSLHSSMVKVVRQSRNQKSMSGFISELPHSLYATALRKNPSSAQKSHILKAIRTPVNEAVSWS